MQITVKYNKVMKKIFLIIILFLVSGCNAIYTINIENNTIKEKLEVQNFDNKTLIDNEYKTLIDLYASSNITTNYNYLRPEVYERIEGFNYYQIEKIDTVNNLGLIMETKYNLDDYLNSTLLNHHFNQVNFNNNDSSFYLNSKKNNDIFKKYFYLNTLTVKVTTDKKVLENNADIINNNTYIWNINKDNQLEKEIIFKFEKTDNDKLFVKDQNNLYNSSTLLIIYGLLFIGIIIFLLNILIKIRKNKL